mmetsp:Transcript_52145/g.121682  ORF Transcript_52145/g.121682 Transcript_52145/m.121682 type:complete len:118 (+) Transcript_52145:51-404(+)
MGRNAKIVRTSAFEKQKRQEKGQEWRKSQWKSAREAEKVAKQQVKPDAMETEGDEQHQKELSSKVGEAMKFFNLADLASSGAGAFMEDAPAGAAPSAAPKDKPAKPKARAKKKKSAT